MGGGKVWVSLKKVKGEPEGKKGGDGGDRHGRMKKN